LKKNTRSWAIGATLFFLATAAYSAPYSVTYSDTITTGGSVPTGINLGETVTVELVLDNGNSSTDTQTWSAADLQCVIFRYNNAQNEFLAINYAGKPLTGTTTGSFTTNGAGQLQPGTFTWVEGNQPLINPFKTNVTVGITETDNWFLNARNDVTFWNRPSYLSVGFANVANDDDPANWTNPVPAAGVCASFFPTTSPQSSSIPTLDIWGVLILIALLVGGAALQLRRRQV
jgi:hypothetical protein